MNIYIGNLSHEATEEDLRQLFETFGQVAAVKIIKDRYSGQSRGFGFVEMPSRNTGKSAIAGLKGKGLKGRTLNVNEARPRSEGGRGTGRQDGRGRGGTRRFW